MQRLARLIAIGALSVSLVGCASAPTQRMASSDKSNVKAVTVSKSVPVPAAMSYLGPGGATGLAFGAVGGALAAPGIEKDRASFQAQAGSSGKPIDVIVYEEALTQIRASGKFPLTEVAEPGSATIHVSVLNYGFSIPNGFSSKLVPILGVRYELQDANGRVLWSASDRTLPLGNPVEGVDAEEIKSNAAAREAAWRGAAKALAVKLLATY